MEIIFAVGQTLTVRWEAPNGGNIYKAIHAIQFVGEWLDKPLTCAGKFESLHGLHLLVDGLEKIPSCRKERDTYPALMFLERRGERILVINVDEVPIKLEASYSKHVNAAAGFWILGHFTAIFEGTAYCLKFEDVVKRQEPAPNEVWLRWRDILSRAANAPSPYTLEKFDESVAEARALLDEYHRAMAEAEAYTVDQYLVETHQ